MHSSFSIERCISMFIMYVIAITFCPDVINSFSSNVNWNAHLSSFLVTLLQGNAAIAVRLNKVRLVSLTKGGRFQFYLM